MCRCQVRHQTHKRRRQSGAATSMLELRASILSPRALVGFDGGRPLVRDVFVVAASGLALLARASFEPALLHVGGL